MKKKKTILVVAIVGLLIVLGVVALFISGQPRFPEIVDAVQLHSDSLALMENSSTDEMLPRDAWPKSVAQLRPLVVVPSTNHVLLTLKGGGIGADPYGYIVLRAPDVKVPDNYRLYVSGSPNIMKCFWGRKYPIESYLEPNNGIKTDQ